MNHLKQKMSRANDTSDRDLKKQNRLFSFVPIFIRPKWNMLSRDNSIVTLNDGAFGKSDFRSSLQPTRIRQIGLIRCIEEWNTREIWSRLNRCLQRGESLEIWSVTRLNSGVSAFPCDLPFPSRRLLRTKAKSESVRSLDVIESRAHYTSLYTEDFVPVLRGTRWLRFQGRARRRTD